MTLESIGRRMDLTRERVRQIESAALRRLRGLLAARDVKPSDLLCEGQRGGGAAGAGGGFGIHTHWYAVVRPSPRSTYRPCG